MTENQTATGSNSDSFRRQLRRGAAEITALQKAVHDTFKYRHKSPEQMEQWRAACAAFHSRYPELAFPGGLHLAFEGVQRNAPEVIDQALTFLEERPYFFRSQYIRAKLTRLCKRAKMDQLQRQRFIDVQNQYQAWVRLKRERAHATKAEQQ